MNERRWRLLYAVLALLAGLPGVITGGALALLCVQFVGVALMTSPGESSEKAVLLAMLAWGLAGVAGVVAWLRMSFALLVSGVPALLSLRRGWWWALLAGAVAALIMLGLLLYSVIRYGGTDYSMLVLAGPPLLIPAAMLGCLYLRRRR